MPQKDLQPVVSILRANAIHPQLDPEDVVASSPQVLLGLYDNRGRLMMPAALRGSHEVLVHQNQIADQDGVTRVQDEQDLLSLRDQKMLVPLPVSQSLKIDPRLPANRRFCRPWVAQFLIAMARAHSSEFSTPLQVNSAVRTVAVQLSLMRRNRNAAQTTGDAASPHLTGQAVDIAKKGLSQAEVGWMRLFLSKLVDAGQIDVEEEFQQACFHVSIYKAYARQVTPPQRIAFTHRPATTTLAATLE